MLSDSIDSGLPACPNPGAAIREVLLRENTTESDRLLLGRLRDARAKLHDIKRLGRAYKNWIDVTRCLLRGGPFPISAKLRTGATVLVQSAVHAHVYSYIYGGIDAPTGQVTNVALSSNGELSFDFNWNGQHKNVTLGGFLGNGDYTIFLRDEYGCLDVANRTVIDVGANIGDSSIYFALKGAGQVIAFEPVRQSFEMACANVRRNGFQDRIQLLREAVSDHPSSVKMLDAQGSLGSQSQDGDGGLPTPVVDLHQIVNTYQTQDAVLKLDCEGEEYRIIGNSNSKTLSAFKEIYLEYHYGGRSLARVLTEAGFRVDDTPPRRFDLSRQGMAAMFVGTIHASRLV